ncbi:O-methyltransferase [Actinophytocola xanthii]|nr:O-methyltransferase [Actinophytocola xanthii]
MSSRLRDYLLAHAEPPTPAQRGLIEATAALGDVGRPRIAHEQGVFLTLLAQAIDATLVVEFGTFTGYSTLALARGLAAGSVVYTNDVSSEWTCVARQAWAEAGVLHRIRQHVGPIAGWLGALSDQPLIDLALIDLAAIATGDHIDCWEALVPRMRPGGMLLTSRSLCAGEVGQDQPTGAAPAVREFNAHVLSDERVSSVLLPVGDGLTLARRRTDFLGMRPE